MTLACVCLCNCVCTQTRTLTYRAYRELDDVVWGRGWVGGRAVSEGVRSVHADHACMCLCKNRGVFMHVFVLREE